MLYISRAALSVLLLLCASLANGQDMRPGVVSGQFPKFEIKASPQPALMGSPATSSEHKTAWKMPEEVVAYLVEFKDISKDDKGNPDFTSSFNYLTTCLQVQEYIYHTLLNSDTAAKEPLPSFYYPVGNPPAFNITTVGEGLKKDSPAAFTVDELVRFMTEMAMIDFPFRWFDFELSIVFVDSSHNLHREVVAEGTLRSIETRPDDEGSPKISTLPNLS